MNRSYKPFEIIQYESKYVRNIDGELGSLIDCNMIAVDFQEEIFVLVPLPDGPYQTQGPITVHRSHCKTPRMKVVRDDT